MSAKIQVGKYFAALERLKARGEPVSNDAVALEAGSGRGSISKSSPAYAELIAAIDSAAEQQARAKLASDPVPGMRTDIDDLTRRLDQSLDREVAQLHEVYDLRAEVKQLAEENRLLKMSRLVSVQCPLFQNGYSYSAVDLSLCGAVKAVGWERLPERRRTATCSRSRRGVTSVAYAYRIRQHPANNRP